MKWLSQHAAPVVERQVEPVTRLTIAERIRAATIADSTQEGVNIADGRFGSAMASLCRELDVWNQGEPVAEISNKYGDPAAFAERELRPLVDIQKLPLDTMLYASPPTPVAVVLPVRSNERDHTGDWTYEAKAWNACLDEVTRLNTK